MKQFLLKGLWVMALLFSVNAAKAQTPEYTTELLGHYTVAQVDSMLTANGVPGALFGIMYEVDLYRVIYTTPTAKGDTVTTASGLIVLPVGDTCGTPIVSYQHGTELKKSESFSNLRGEWFLSIICSSTGYVSCMPDYLGMGYSPVFHPYQHAKSEANAVIDLIRVAKDFAPQHDVDLNGQLFLMGYSQGGHATMAAHRDIQELYSNEMTVTASAPMSGAYDMSGAQFEMVASFDPYSNPGYLPYLIKGYNEAYDGLYTDWSDILKSPYDQTIPPLITGSMGMGAVNDEMPPVPRDVIDSAYAAEFFADSLHPFRLALKDNDVYKWVPTSPVRMSYCTLDEQVTPNNAWVAYNYMIGHGAQNITVVDRGELTHRPCADPSILFTKFWFDSMATFCQDVSGILNNLETSGGWVIGYNTEEQKITGSLNNYKGESYSVGVYSSTGLLVQYSGNLTTQKFDIDMSALPCGLYVVWSDNHKGLWGKIVK